MPCPLNPAESKSKDSFPEYYVWVWNGPSATGFSTILWSYREIRESLGGGTLWEEARSLGVCLSRRLLWPQLLPISFCFSVSKRWTDLLLLGAPAIVYCPVTGKSSGGRWLATGSSETISTHKPFLLVSCSQLLCCNDRKMIEMLKKESFIKTDTGKNCQSPTWCLEEFQFKMTISTVT